MSEYVKRLMARAPACCSHPGGLEELDYHYVRVALVDSAFV
jgi:hypothetical protein